MLYMYMYVQYVHVILNACIQRNMQPYLNSICDNQRHVIFFFILDDHYNMHDMYIYGVYILFCLHINIVMLYCI